MTPLETSLLISTLILAAALIIVTVTTGRTRSRTWKLLERTGEQVLQARAHLAQAQAELRRYEQRENRPAPKPSGTATSLRKIINENAPTTRREARANGMVIVPLETHPSAPYGFHTDTPSSSCDTSSGSSDSGSSSSSDGGSCGGGE